MSFENGKKYLIRFKIWNNGPIFDLIQNEKKNTIRTALITMP